MATITISIAAAINQPPNSTGWGSAAMLYNALYVFTLEDFTTETIPPYADPEGDALENVKITVLPTLGSLLLSAVPVVANDNISSADLIAGNLTYQADVAVTAGYFDADMMFTVSDVGSSTFTSPAYRFELTAEAQENQPPSAVGDGVMNLEYGETGVFTRAMFTTLATPPYADPEGDAALILKITGLPVLGEIQLNGVPVIVNQTITFANIDLGVLTYVPDLADTDGDMQGFTHQIADEGSGEFVG